MDFSQLQSFFEKEPKYRLEQAQRALFQDLIHGWQEAIALPLILRDKLDKEFPIGIIAEESVSKDKNTIKALITLSDGLKIETVLMRHGDKRNTVCVSSQVGCAMNCSFCATGKLGFKRNLGIWEIIEQVLFFARHLKELNEKVTNIVFMGMGEPFLNYENVMGAIRILNDGDKFNLGARHISVSTAGIIEGIEKLTDEGLQINLAVSLHAPNDELRSKLMPVNKKYPIGVILNAVNGYIAKTRRRVMFEYIMINGINDSDEHALALAKLMSKSLYFVNLIPCNPTGIFKTSTQASVKRFRDLLERGGVVATQRFGFGRDIDGACGQLATKSVHPSSVVDTFQILFQSFQRGTFNGLVDPHLVVPIKISIEMSSTMISGNMI